MDLLEKFNSQIRRQQSLLFLLNGGLVVGAWWYFGIILEIDQNVLLWLLIAVTTVFSLLFTLFSSQYITKPVRLLSQAILHVSPEAANTPPPELANAHLGRELVTNLVSHIYQLAQVVGTVEKINQAKTEGLSHEFVANTLPLPLLVLDKDQNIIFANQAMTGYLAKDSSEVIGQNIHTVFDVSFSSHDTIDSWLTQARTSKAVDAHTWLRARLSVGNSPEVVRQFDLTGYYNKNNPSGYETLLVLFDRTQQYNQDDQGLSFVALAVHELRTPITLLRGYLEAFEEDLGNQATPELTDYLHKMKASAQQLTVFINNILNVARIENNQLSLKLQKEDWPKVVQAAISDIQLRASTRGITLTTDIAPDLPPVAIDTVSMYEVLNNLVDNAIKYSNPDDEVIIKTYRTKDGMVETTVQDFGIGMSGNIVSNLFEKFYRSHRSKSKVGGTGLGLFLCKEIIEASGGNIWVRSREGEGSTFGFTIKPFSEVDAKEQNSDNEGIIRHAHGWIKNHSMYRG